MRGRVVVCVFVSMALGGFAQAGPHWHAGLNVRADAGAHPFRGVAGLDLRALDISLTLDPMVVFDGEFDADLLTTTRVSDAGWGILAGWRTTAIDILGGRQFQEKVVLGFGAPVPRLGSLPLRMRWAIEGAFSTTAEVFDAIRRHRPAAVDTSEARLMRRWLER